MMKQMSVKIAGVELKNPVMTASGTFGSGMEYSEFTDPVQTGSCSDKGCGKCAVAGQSYPTGGGDSQRDAECHWPAESRSRNLLQQRSSHFSGSLTRRLL